jgi:formylglycine-generating enzyme required for sulfatase activity
MKLGWSSVLLLLLTQPAMAQRKYNMVKGGPLLIETVSVKGGTYDLGDDSGTIDRRPARSVQLADFKMSKYEIKQEQWEAVMGENPSEYKCAICPVTNVSWTDVQTYIGKLNEATGKKYRLPTEAEWEYAARGGEHEVLVKPGHLKGGPNELLVAERNHGTKTREKTYIGEKWAGRSGGIQSIAWYVNNANGKVHQVGFKQPNELGLYDMTGNVEEWCSDWYAKTYGTAGDVKNPKGPSSGRAKVVRGGSIESTPKEATVTRRYAYLPDTKTKSLGFRLIEE